LSFPFHSRCSNHLERILFSAPFLNDPAIDATHGEFLLDVAGIFGTKKRESFRTIDSVRTGDY